MSHKSPLEGGFPSNFIVGVQTWKSESGKISHKNFEDEDTKRALEDELEHDLSPSELFELQRLQSDELITLQETYGRILDQSQQPILIFGYPEITLNIITGTHYPRQPPVWEIENHSLPRKVIDGLRATIREYLALRAGDATIEAQDRKYLLGVAAIAKDHLSAYRAKVLASSFASRGVISTRTAKSKQSASPNEFTDSAYSLLDKTLPQIFLDFDPDIRVLHVETVLRSDLGFRFHTKRDQLRRKFEEMTMAELAECIPRGHQAKRREDMIEYLTKPRVTFHGTDANMVPNIVRRGFLPGEHNHTPGDEHRDCCGSSYELTYENGICTSPDPSFSHHYTNGEPTNWTKKRIGGRKLIVCAQLMGRSIVVGRERRGTTQTIMDADSQVSPNQLEYIVFDPAMVLPCYVIHYEHVSEDYENDVEDDNAWAYNPSNINRLSNKFGPALTPGDAQRRKAEIFSRGSKWFPYGYGPATNGKFVIEDVAEIDDDEEEWGNYQEDRAVEGNDGIGPWGAPVGMTDRDQYAAQRKENITERFSK